MNTQAWRQRIAVLITVAITYPIVSQATLITASISDTGLSGTLVYEDTAIITGTGFFSDWTFVALTSFTANYGPAPTTWDLADYVPPGPAFDLYLAKDAAGTMVLGSYDLTGSAASAGVLFLNSSEYRLGFEGLVTPCGSSYCADSSYYVQYPDNTVVSSGAYVISTAVPEPTVLSLLCLGFAALGITRRKMKA